MLLSLLLLLGLGSAPALAGQYNVPGWKPTYKANLSTIIMPCDNQGFITDPTIRRFGVVDLDWTNSKDLWKVAKPMTAEENLVKQAALMTSVTPEAKIWVYRNTVLAMPWFASVRKILEDPAYSPWFLHFKAGPDCKGPLHHDGDGTYYHPVCDHGYDPPKCSELFHSMEFEIGDDRAVRCGPVSEQCDKTGRPSGNQTTCKSCDCGLLPCGMYLFDHRSNVVINNQTLAEWFVSDLILSPTGLLNPNISGFFIDDTWSQSGAGDLNGSEVLDIGLSSQELTDLTNSWVRNMDTVKAAILKRNGFIWQQMVNNGTCAGPVVPKDPQKCVSTLREVCKPGSPENTGALFYGLTSQAGCAFCAHRGHPSSPDPAWNADFANFMLIRGDYAWLGYAWGGCGHPYWRPDDVLNKDYGIPLGLCKESGGPNSGIFTREWTKATVTMDCSTYTGSVVLHEGKGSEAAVV